MKKASLKSKTNSSAQINLNEPTVWYEATPSLILGKSDASDMDVLKMVKNGISKKIFDQTLQMMGITLEDAAPILHVSERTLRRYHDDTILNTEQSERIMELNNLYTYGQEVFGSMTGFKLWLESPILALGQRKPKEFLDTSLGIRMLTTLLSRIEYGVYS